MSQLTPKKLILFGLAAILLIAIPLTVYLVQRQQDLKSRAAPSTTLTFQPSSATAAVGQEVTFDIMINPNSNFVSFVHLVISYDPTKLEKSGAGLSINTNVFPGFDPSKSPPAPTFNSAGGKITVDMAVGGNPSAFIQHNNTKVGTLTLNAIASTEGTTTPITFGSETQVLTGQGDQFNTNVLSSTTPASVTITEAGTLTPTPTQTPQASPTPTPSCQAPPVVTNVKVEYPNCEGAQCSFTQANCSWDAITGVTSYAIKISQVESGEVVRNDSVNASTSRVVFSVVQDKTYKCDVSAVNSCGTGPAGTHSLLCSVQGVVATPTPASTTVPVSTTIPTLVPTATPIPTINPAPTTAPLVVTTPTPTMAPSGPGDVIIGIGVFGIILSIIGGFLLFIL